MGCARVVIADRYPVVIEGLSKLLGDEPDFEIVACCNDGESCIVALREFAPDILVFDALLLGVTALEILSIINSEKLPTRLILFTASDEKDEAVISAAVGNYSLVPKNLAPDLLLESLRRVMDGKQVSPAPSWEQGMRAENAIAANALAMLTDRERQIVRLVSEGLSNKEVGKRLNITDGTIKVHLHNIFQKLEINNRTVLAALAISNGDLAGSSNGTSPPRQVD